MQLTICETLYLDMYLQIGDLNPYALDFPVCLEGSPAKHGRAQRNWLMNHVLGGMQMSAGMLGAVSDAIGLKEVQEYVPCEIDYTTEYLNLPEVKAALHVVSQSDRQTDSRQFCASYIFFFHSHMPCRLRFTFRDTSDTLTC